MKNKPLGVDKMGIQKTMRFKDYLADCGGQFALNTMSGLIAAIMYFYTDKVGVAAATAANVLLAAKICDAFTDLIMGKIMDNGNSPKGKCRPWFLRMAIPAFVAIVAIFMVPQGLTGFAQIAYLFLTNIFLTAIVSTAISIPYGALMVMRTKSLEERSTMGIFRAAAGYVIGMIIAIALVPITNLLGPNGVADQAAYIKFAVVVGALSAVFLLILYFNSKETAAAEEKPDDGMPFKEAIGKLFKNKYWVIVLVANLFVNVIYALSSSSGTYYAKWILGDDNIVGILGAVGLIPTFVGFSIVGPMTKKFGIVKTLKISFILGIAGNIVRCIFPASLPVTLGVALFTGFSTIPMMCLGGALNSMAIDYNDYLYHNKIVGMSASATSFGAKIASGLGASLIGWILAAVHYDASAAAATTSVRYGIYGFSIYLPLLMMIGLYLMIRKFDLEAKYPEMMAEIKARNEAEAATEKTVE
ncbi:MAG: MFS transporter [Lachnospiraceae bacterium]|nr:MFS transporter [Lachnospiraceae bacterium]